MSKESRELTRGEKKAIHALVEKQCANYDCTLGCLVMGGACYMLQKEYSTGALCRYFRNAVLPKDPALEAALTGKESKQCPVCGKRFAKESRRKYCSDTCSRKAKKKKST